VGLQIATTLAAFGAVVAVLFSGPIGVWAGAASVTFVILTPMLRVLWLVFSWWRERDVLFATVGIALLGIMGLGALLAVWING
jgi:hypothetical protein